MSERLVVSPWAGRFEPSAEVTALTPEMRRARNGAVAIEVGALVGLVGGKEVRSSFGGKLEGVLVLPGERVVAGQPVAWVRPAPQEIA